jgi:hypothetical protein
VCYNHRDPSFLLIWEGMKLHFQLAARVEQKLETTLTMKQVMAQSLVDSIRDTIDKLRSGSLGNTSALLTMVMETTLLQAQEQVRDPVVRAALDVYFRDPTNISYMASHVDALAQATIAGFGLFARQALIESLPNEGDGIFTLKPGDREMGSTFVSLDRALKEPEKIRAALDNETALARGELRDSAGSAYIAQIGEGRRALEMAEELAPYLEVGQRLLEIAFCVTGVDSEPLLPRFFREAAVMKDLDWELSERIARRFVTRFASARSNTPAYEFKDAMVNTIGEFSLVSLGILAPSLFRRARGHVDELEVLFADQLVDDATDGVKAVAASLRKYKLAERGPIYWCRWALPDGVKLTPVTDDLVRDFIRVTVAADTDEVLTAFKFDDFFGKIKELRSQTTGDKGARAAHYAEALGRALGEQEFRDFLIAKCSSQWFPRLQSLLKLKT